MCDVGYLCANFGLGLFVLDLGSMYATDRQTSDVRQTSDSIIALCPRLLGAGHNKMHGALRALHVSLNNASMSNVRTMENEQWPPNNSPSLKTI